MAIKAFSTITLVKVDDGQNGADGIGIKSITTQYYLSDSSTSQTGGSWVEIPPEWSPGKYIWTRSHIIWSDDSESYTTPVLNKTLNSIEGKLILDTDKNGVAYLTGQAQKIHFKAGQFSVDSENFTLDENGNLTASSGNIGKWKIATDGFESSYEEASGGTGWSGHTKIIPARWDDVGEHEAGLLLNAYRAGVGSDNSSGWFKFYRKSGSGSYENLKIGNSMLGGSAIVSDRYNITSELTLGQIGDDTTSLSSYGAILKVDNGHGGKQTSIEIKPGENVQVHGGITVDSNAIVSGNINASGIIQAGKKIQIRTDGEGGNLRIEAPDSYNRHWEVDAHNGDFRIYTMTNNNQNYKNIVIDTYGNLHTDGWLYLAGNLITDFIISNGVSGNWSYWKWYSGLAICIHNPIQCGGDGNVYGSAWGSIYSSDDYVFSAYPFTFVGNVPAVYASRTTADNATYNSYQTFVALSGGSLTTPPRASINRGTAVTIGHPYLSLVAIGRWR